MANKGRWEGERRTDIRQIMFSRWKIISFKNGRWSLSYIYPVVSQSTLFNEGNALTVIDLATDKPVALGSQIKLEFSCVWCSFKSKAPVKQGPPPPPPPPPLPVVPHSSHIIENSFYCLRTPINLMWNMYFFTSLIHFIYQKHKLPA